jgi:hypothetical protein
VALRDAVTVVLATLEMSRHAGGSLWAGCLKLEEQKQRTVLSFTKQCVDMHEKHTVILLSHTGLVTSMTHHQCHRNFPTATIGHAVPAQYPKGHNCIALTSGLKAGVVRIGALLRLSDSGCR